MGKVQFVLNGKQACIGGPGPQAQKAIEFIKKIPDGKYFNTDGIAGCLKSTKNAIGQALRRYVSEVDGHYILVPNAGHSAPQFVYGSKKSIADLKKKLQEQDII